MAGVHKYSEQTGEADFESNFDPKQDNERFELLDRHEADRHARALQNRLLQAYEGLPAGSFEWRLSLAQRLVIICGLTCGLWAIIGAVVFVQFG